MDKHRHIIDAFIPSERLASAMLYDPLVARYRNDVHFHHLVNSIRHSACDHKATEAMWRDAVQLAFEMERQHPTV